jgi:putative glutamine amidotransferase
MAFNRKIYVVGQDYGAANWMEGETIVPVMDQSTVVLFTGGPDVNPALYKSERHPKTFVSNTRDMLEVAAYKEAIRLAKPMVGICRGAQFLCVMNGGMLVQHQANADVIHPMKTMDGKEIMVSSDHHQACYPWGLNQTKFKLLGWSIDQSPFHFNSHDFEMVRGVVEDDKEVEAIYFPETRSLGLQYHPEWMWPKRKVEQKMDESIKWTQTILDRLMWNTL